MCSSAFTVDLKETFTQYPRRKWVRSGDRPGLQHQSKVTERCAWRVRFPCTSAKLILSLGPRSGHGYGAHAPRCHSSFHFVMSEVHSFAGSCLRQSTGLTATRHPGARYFRHGWCPHGAQTFPKPGTALSPLKSGATCLGATCLEDWVLPV